MEDMGILKGLLRVLSGILPEGLITSWECVPRTAKGCVIGSTGMEKMAKVGLISCTKTTKV